MFYNKKDFSYVFVLYSGKMLLGQQLKASTRCLKKHTNFETL